MNKPKIFVFDESQSELDYIEDVLNTSGYVTIPAKNKKDFFGLLSRLQANLIVLDIVMPEGDGYQICSALKNHPEFSSIPVIFLTALTNDEDIKRGLEFGAVDFITKPFEKEIFLHRVKMILNQFKQAERYTAIFNRMKDGFCLVEPVFKNNKIVDTRYLEVNDSFLQIFGKTKNEVIGKTTYDLMPDTSNDWLEPIINLMHTGNPIAFEKFHESSEKWFSIKGYPISKSVFCVSFYEITEKKNVAIDLSLSKRNYELLFENMNNAFSVQKIITDSNNKPIDYEFVEANSMVAVRFGIAREELIGKTIKTIFPNIEDKWLDLFGRVALGGKAESFTDYSAEFDRYYHVHVYSPKERYFATTFNDVTERNTIEKALKESEEKYRVIADNISDWVWKSDLQLNFTYISPAVERIRGVSVEEALVEKVEDAFPPESIVFFKQLLNERMILIDQGQEVDWDPTTFEVQLYKKDKSKIWVQISARFIKDENGNPIEIIGVARDINQQKKVEQALYDNEKRYRSLFENAKDPVLLMKGDQFIECNQTTLDILGYTSKVEFLKLKPWEISPKVQPNGISSKQKAEEAIKLVFEKGHSTFECVHLHTSGKAIWFHISMAKVTLKGEVIIYTIWRDITSKKSAEIALKESEEKYRLITDSIGDLVWKTDLDLNFTYLSPSIEKLRGFNADEALKLSFNEILLPKDVSKINTILEAKLKQIREGDERGWDAEVIDLQSYKKDKSIIWVQISARFISGDDGMPKEIIGVSRDITSQKNTELALSESQNLLLKHNKDKDRFISILSHDLIGTVGSSIQVIEMLEKKGLAWEKRNEFTDYLFDNTKSSFALLNDMVKWGKASLGKESIHYNTIYTDILINKITELYATELKQKHISILNKCESKLNIVSDEQMLESILRNLIKNAIKYSFHKSSISISCKSVQNRILWSVSDEGVGMTEESAAELFNLSSLNSEPGTEGELGIGLGLQLVKEYVSLLGGEIWAESQLSKGTTIFFYTENVPLGKE